MDPIRFGEAPRVIFDIASITGFTGAFTAEAESTVTGLTGHVTVRGLLPMSSRLGANY